MKKQRIKKIVAFALFLLVLISFTVLICDTADARAGGGQRYSGGGSGSSRGSRGSGGGSIDLIFFLIRLIFYYPLIGIPVTILVIYLVAKGYLAGDDAYVDYTIKRGSKVRPQADSQAALAALKSKDPGFDQQIFVARVRKAFEIIQNAWSKRDLEKAQPFLSDGIFEQFSIQLAEMKEKGLIDHMENLSILSVLPVRFQSDKNFDVIHIKINARSINYCKDEKSGKVVNGSRVPAEFSEVWSFLRKPGAKTLKKPGLIEGQCPNCGNPIQVGRLVKCEICNSLLRSGEYDWVLSEITQACEWSVRPTKSIPGLKEMIAQDPGFNIQHIEDRVSVMFWRKVESQRKADISLLRKIAKNEYCDELASSFKADKAGNRGYFGDCAVGSVDLLGIEIGESEDQLFVDVIWSGYATTVTADKKHEMAKKPTNIKCVFALSRKHGSKTSLENSLSSSHCPSCGAPEQTGVENECAYCGAVMNDGSKEWVLSGIMAKSDAKLRQIMVDMNSLISEEAPLRKAPGGTDISRGPIEEFSVSGMELVKWTVAMMLADGEIDQKEMDLVTELAERKSISKDKLNKVISELKGSGDPVAAMIGSGPFDNGAEIFRQLARVALADGKLAKEEVAMLKTVGGKIGYVEADIDMLLKKERANLYREAKEALKNARI